MAIKVLIVEDDSNIAQLLQLYLEKEGFETQVAADGGQGVDPVPQLCAGLGAAGHHAPRAGRLGRVQKDP